MTAWSSVEGLRGELGNGMQKSKETKISSHHQHS